VRGGFRIQLNRTIPRGLDRRLQILSSMSTDSKKARRGVRREERKGRTVSRTAATRALVQAVVERMASVFKSFA
jgi:hypothetical protein